KLWLRKLLPVCFRHSAPRLQSAEKLSEMADAASNLAGALICYMGPKREDFLARDEKALVRPFLLTRLRQSVDIPWILSFINWHKDWVRPRPKKRRTL